MYVGSAISAEGQDFDFADGQSVLISAGQNEDCLQISIISSDVLEPQEEINLAINTTTTDDAAFGAISTTTVIIRSGGRTYISASISIEPLKNGHIGS